MSDAQTPLAGLRVVSMAEQYPGPFCTMILSDLGADVIQVERPGTGDPSRFLTGFYDALNRGKRSVALDIRNDADKAALLDLVAGADVFLEGFRPGKLARQGLGHDALSALNPGLIYCSISGYGQTGPYRDRPGHDLSLQGVGGALDERIDGSVTGLPPGLLLGDNAAGLFATIGILTALLARARTGEGTHIDIAMSDSVTALFTAFVGMVGQPAAPPPQAEPGYDIFTCGDGRMLTLSIAHEDAYWDRLCGDLDLPYLAGLTRTERVARRDEIKALIGAVIARRTLAEWEPVLEASGQMWGPVNRLEDVPGDPHVMARGLVERMTRADGGAQWIVRQPVKFSQYRNAELRPAPGLGAHQGQGFRSTGGQGGAR